MDLEAILAILIVGAAVLLPAVIGLIIAAAVLVPLFLLGRYMYRRSQQAQAVREASQKWFSTSGQVTKSRVEVSGGERTSVTPRVVYEYTVGGQRYQSDQIRAGDKFLSFRSDRQAYEIIDRYPQGATVTVYYDPADPAQAALER
jgi:hypothetical protein